MDSGSEQDLISEHMLKSVGAKDRRHSDAPISLITANGNTVAHEVADVHFSNLLEPATPYILEQTPSVLSVGVKCLDQGYSFVWPNGKRPFLVRPDGCAVVLKIDGHVPVLDDTCEVKCRTEFNPECIGNLLAVAAVSRDAREPESEDAIDESGDADEEEARVVRSMKLADLTVEAASKEHQFLHFPKNPFCRVCQRARMMAPYARSKGGQARIETSNFGDHIIADHVILKANIEEGLKGEKVALVVKDLHTHSSGMCTPVHQRTLWSV